MRCFWVCFVLLCLLGCNRLDQIKACRAEIPTSLSFLPSDFSSLQYFKHVAYGNGSKKSYDLWADAKFNYQSALQFDAVRMDKNDIHSNCINAVTLRMALPLTPKQQSMLKIFTNQIALRASINPARVQKTLSRILTRGDQVALITKNNGIKVTAGTTFHQFRGKMFILSMEGETFPSYFS